MVFPYDPNEVAGKIIDLIEQNPDSFSTQEALAKALGHEQSAISKAITKIADNHRAGHSVNIEKVDGFYRVTGISDIDTSILGRMAAEKLFAKSYYRVISKRNDLKDNLNGETFVFALNEGKGEIACQLLNEYLPSGAVFTVCACGETLILVLDYKSDKTQWELAQKKLQRLFGGIARYTVDNDADTEAGSDISAED